MQIEEVTVEDRFVDVGGLRIHYLCAGETGAAAVLLHGGGLDSARISWGAIVGPLAEAGHRVYAPDCPGYGDSDRPDAEYSVDYYVDFMRDFMDALGLARASLIGISMGGAIALGMALRFPERVDRLVLVDSYGIQRTVEMHRLSYLITRIPGVMTASYPLFARMRGLTRASLGSIVHDAKAVPDSLIDELLLEARKPRAGRAFAWMQQHDITWSGLRTVYIDRLGEIRAPALFIHGREDRQVPLHWAEEAHARLPGSQLLVIDQAGHWPQPEHAEKLIAAAASFLRG